jgi:hypothetical protein
MSKDEILTALEDVRENFLNAIEGLDDSQLNEPGVVDDWSVKDLIVHISMWEAELVKLLWQVRQGQAPTTIHFTKTGSVDDINAAWDAASKGRTLEQAMADFRGVRKQTERRVQSFNDQELTEKDHFPGLRGFPLAEWIANDSYDHESEHIAQIIAWRDKVG